EEGRHRPDGPVGREVLIRQRGKQRHQAEGRDDLRRRRGGPETPHHHEVHRHPDRGAAEQAHDQGDRPRHAGAWPQVVEDVTAEHPDRARGEVGHAGAAVDDHDALAQHGVARADRQAGESQLKELHCYPAWVLLLVAPVSMLTKGPVRGKETPFTYFVGAIHTANTRGPKALGTGLSNETGGDTPGQKSDTLSRARRTVLAVTFG